VCVCVCVCVRKVNSWPLCCGADIKPIFQPWGQCEKRIVVRIAASRSGQSLHLRRFLTLRSEDIQQHNGERESGRFSCFHGRRRPCEAAAGGRAESEWQSG